MFFVNNICKYHNKIVAKSLIFLKINLLCLNFSLLLLIDHISTTSILTILLSNTTGFIKILVEAKSLKHSTNSIVLKAISTYYYYLLSSQYTTFSLTILLR